MAAVLGETRGDVPAQECRALGNVISRIGDKWTVMVVGHLSTGSLRFNDLMRVIPGISHRMLTITLRGLERDGLVNRTAFATTPPRVDYELTELGQSLTVPLSILAGWASAKRTIIEDAQQRFDQGRDAAADGRS
ncbi:helix-turn-helix domain-containing protein [Devosia sp.]|uniref:winged helix-turn-helix transcriptional regulator n=1 Tax=Devosia sp. TaxID=1871048 RepID=UPI0026332A0B|nr:helix-turn-helix domain-containing protein [Devosia sp.]